jgi:diketogulonate reductase-like aldo/keto reductase
MTVRTAQQHGQAYMDRLLTHAQKGELNPACLANHRFSLEDGPRGYDMFNHKTDGCVRAVFAPKAHVPSTDGGKSMEQRPFGPVPREVAVIGQGTWYIDDAHRPTAVAALRRGLDLGMTHIDTAEMYGDAETVVGEAIAGRRDDVFLVSKVLPSNASLAGTVAACERSLARLRTDRLDCYLLHWPGSHPLEDTFAGFERLREQGKILSWGVSNFDVPNLEAAWKAGGDGRIACNQVLYHLEERAIEHAVQPWCEDHGIAVVAYSPFGHGSFPGPRTSGGRVLDEIAANHGATARQVALRFLARRPSTFTIPKASSPEHAADNASAGPLRLTEDEFMRIDAAFPRGPRPRHLPML